MGWFDTHAHLSDPKFILDRDLVIDDARKSGVDRIVEIADGPSEWPKAKELAEKYRGRIWWAAGLHPYYADQSSPELWKKLGDESPHPQFVGIGEIGLDYAKCPIPSDVQIQAFRSGIELALGVNKPIIVHCRNAFDDLLPVLRSYFKPQPPNQSPGVIHCFSGTLQAANELIGMGFYLGVDAPITYPNSKELRETLSQVPLEKLVLETDSPYLPPQSHRGKRNEPRFLDVIGPALAAMHSTTVDALMSLLFENSNRLYRLA